MRHGTARWQTDACSARDPRDGSTPCRTCAPGAVGSRRSLFVEIDLGFQRLAQERWGLPGTEIDIALIENRPVRESILCPQPPWIDSPNSMGAWSYRL